MSVKYEMVGEPIPGYSVEDYISAGLVIAPYAVGPIIVLGEEDRARIAALKKIHPPPLLIREVVVDRTEQAG